MSGNRIEHQAKVLLVGPRNCGRRSLMRYIQTKGTDHANMSASLGVEFALFSFIQDDMNYKAGLFSYFCAPNKPVILPVDSQPAIILFCIAADDIVDYKRYRTQSIVEKYKTIADVVYADNVPAKKIIVITKSDTAGFANSMLADDEGLIKALGLALGSDSDYAFTAVSQQFSEFQSTFSVLFGASATSFRAKATGSASMRAHGAGQGGCVGALLAAVRSTGFGYVGAHQRVHGNYGNRDDIENDPVNVVPGFSINYTGNAD